MGDVTLVRDKIGGGDFFFCLLHRRVLTSTSNLVYPGVCSVISFHNVFIVIPVRETALAVRQGVLDSGNQRSNGLHLWAIRFGLEEPGVIPGLRVPDQGRDVIHLCTWYLLVLLYY